jgi:hypothetical protein
VLKYVRINLTKKKPKTENYKKAAKRNLKKYLNKLNSWAYHVPGSSTV